MNPKSSKAMSSAAVVGLGRIGSEFDHDRPAGLHARTHLGAIVGTLAFGSIIGIDPCPERRDAAAKRWQAHAVTCLAEPTAVGAVDVLAICTPAGLRLDAVAGFLKQGVRVLVIEKPLALTIAEAERIVSLAADAHVELRVNFHRRFDPGIRAARAALGGAVPRMVVMRYGKGLYNYASHHVDLLLDWFGDIDSVQAIGDELEGDDPTLSFRCRLAAGFDAIVLGMHGLDYDQFEIDVFTPDRRLELVAGGVEKRLYQPVRERFYAGYSHLGEPVAAAPAGQVSGFGELYAAIVAHLRDGVPLPGCTGVEALAGLRVLDAARRSAVLGGAVIELERSECRG